MNNLFSTKERRMLLLIGVAVSYAIIGMLTEGDGVWVWKTASSACCGLAIANEIFGKD